MATIKTMNNISKKGLSLFGSFYHSTACWLSPAPALA